MLHTKFGGNRFPGSGEKDFFKVFSSPEPKAHR